MAAKIDSQIRFRSHLFNILEGTSDLKGITLLKSDDLTSIEIQSGFKMIPDFRLKWDSNYNQYRVYLLIAVKGCEKEETGFPVMVVRSRMAASFLVVVIQILHKYRAGNKEN